MPTTPHPTPRDMREALRECSLQIARDAQILERERISPFLAAGSDRSE